MLFTRQPKVRLGERRNKARLYCQRSLEEMEHERQQLKDFPAHAISNEDEETNLRSAFAVSGVLAQQVRARQLQHPRRFCTSAFGGGAAPTSRRCCCEPLIPDPTSCSAFARLLRNNTRVPSCPRPPRTSACSPARCRSFPGNAFHARTRERTSTGNATSPSPCTSIGRDHRTFMTHIRIRASAGGNIPRSRNPSAAPEGNPVANPEGWLGLECRAATSYRQKSLTSPVPAQCSVRCAEYSCAPNTLAGPGYRVPCSPMRTRRHAAACAGGPKPQLSLSSSPLPSILANPAVVNGAQRSLVKTNGLFGSCSR